jgi:hypothetical protein
MSRLVELRICINKYEIDKNKTIIHSIPIANESKPFPLLIKIKSNRSKAIKPIKKNGTVFLTKLRGIIK